MAQYRRSYEYFKKTCMHQYLLPVLPAAQFRTVEDCISLQGVHVVHAPYAVRGKWDSWITTKDHHFVLSTGERITVPKGYITDFASVPPWLWSIFPSIGKHNLAALLHDYLYDRQYTIGGTIKEDRRQCDKEFLIYMNALTVKPVSAKCMYWGVRLGGRKWYNE